MSADTPEEIAGLRAAGALVRTIIDAVTEAAQPGVTTLGLDELAADVMHEHGARSGPILTYRYPGSICLSVGDEVVHGIPGDRVLRTGELLTIDVALELNGFYADAASTVPVGGAASPQDERLIAAARAALKAGIRAAKPGATLRDVGAAVERVTETRGFRVVRELTGHGIGRAMHEEPTVYNWPAPKARQTLTPGLVFTIEPMIVAGDPTIAMGGDGWTVSTVDGSRSAHEEHTIVVADGEAIVVTA